MLMKVDLLFLKASKDRGNSLVPIFFAVSNILINLPV